MLFKTLLFINLLICSECFLYSSFWAPLFNPRILNYKVDVPFDPDAGVNAREDFQKKYGYRGEKLIADLGNGKGPTDYSNMKEYGEVKYGEVKFSYTYSGADKNSKYEY